MRIYRNTAEIVRKEKLGRRLTLIGMLILFVGLIASFTPNRFPPGTTPTGPIGQFFVQYWTYISFVSLPLGFLAASVGSYFNNRYARRRWPGTKWLDRPDNLFERSLKGFDDKYAFFAYSLPASYVVAGPCGVQVFAVRSDRSRVVARGERWREPFSFTRLLTVFAREGVGDPVRDVQDQAGRLRTLLAPGEGGNAALAGVPIEGAAVFLNPLAQIEIDHPAIPVLRADGLKEHLRRRARELKLPTSTVRALTESLREKAIYQSEEESAEAEE